MRACSRSDGNYRSSCNRIADIDGSGHFEFSVLVHRESGDEGAASALDFPLTAAALIPQKTNNETGNTSEDDYGDYSDFGTERDVDECV